MQKIKAGIVGLGRLGRKYAENLRYKVRHVELISACSIRPEEMSYAKDKLGIKHVFTDYGEMLASGKLDTVFVISSTDQHANHFIKALQVGLHVFCEKPLALDVTTCEKVEAVAANHPDQLAVVGFVRRFDPSYAYAKKKVDEGAIGTPFFVKSQTVDIDATAKFQVEFAKTSGGLFHDFNVHDIDLARWFLNSNIETVFATGGTFKHSEYAEVGDADNVLATCVMENGTMASIHASRTSMHGHDTFTEIVGTEGVLRVGRPATLNRVEISDRHGVRHECVQTFYDRFEEAFLLQAQDFIDCIVDGRKPELTLRDAMEATRGAEALTRSFRERGLVRCGGGGIRALFATSDLG